MNQKDLQPASNFAKQYGVKMIAYGPPGKGKTPLVNTAPRPVLAFVEPGMLSMKRSNVPAWDATTPDRCDEFFDWFFRSHEAKQYDTLGIDSASEMAEMYLKLEKGRNKNGLKAYGLMAEKVMERIRAMYYMPNKHIYLICKMGKRDAGEDMVEKAPYFPGQELNVQVPHLFDLISYIDMARIPGVVNEQLAIRTRGTIGISARDRSGNLNEFEPPNLTELFAKAMK